MRAVATVVVIVRPESPRDRHSVSALYAMIPSPKGPPSHSTRGRIAPCDAERPRAGNIKRIADARPIRTVRSPSCRGQVFKFHFWPDNPLLTQFRHRHCKSTRASFARPKMKFEDLTPDRFKRRAVRALRPHCRTATTTTTRLFARRPLVEWQRKTSLARQVPARPLVT